MLISCAVTAQLICIFVFIYIIYAKIHFSGDMAQISPTVICSIIWCSVILNNIEILYCLIDAVCPQFTAEVMLGIIAVILNIVSLYMLMPENLIFANIREFIALGIQTSC